MILGDGHWLHIRGGYTDTYICTKNRKVVKFCDKYYSLETSSTSKTATASNKTHVYNNNHIVHYSTICDLVFSKSLEKINDFPKINRCDIYDSKVRIDMEYLGKTLHDVCHSYSIQTRWRLMPKFIEQIALQSFNLLYNGIQHTDIKPGNILLDDQHNFHLIDFNCMSTVYIDHTQTRKWCDAIGTYHYLAPEILFSGKPHDSSMVWSIGMVGLHWLLGHYPISEERMIKYISHPPSTHSQWKKIMYELRKKYPASMQLEKKYLETLEGWWTRLQPMLKWNPYKRWSLTTVLQAFHIHSLPRDIRVKNILYTADASHQDTYCRRTVIEKASQFLKHIQMEYLLSSSVILYDKCYPFFTTMDLDLLYLCCWAIQGYLTNRFLFDDDNTVFTIHQMYNITCDKIIAELYTVGMSIEFDAWQKEWYTIVCDMYPNVVWTIDWNIMKIILINKTSSYNAMTLANDYTTFLEFKELDKVK